MIKQLVNHQLISELIAYHRRRSKMSIKFFCSFLGIAFGGKCVNKLCPNYKWNDGLCYDHENIKFLVDTLEVELFHNVHARFQNISEAVCENRAVTIEQSFGDHVHMESFREAAPENERTRP